MTSREIMAMPDPEVTASGNTVECMMQIQHRHEIMFRKAVLGLSAFVRVGYDDDKPAFFETMIQFVLRWAKEDGL